MQHTHLQLNVQQTMGAAKIREDVIAAFSLRPTTIVFDEAVAVTHEAIRAGAKARGYEVLIPTGAASQVVLAWDASVYELVSSKVTFAMKGKEHVSPNRYVVRAKLRDTLTGQLVVLVGTHMVSSGWTGSKSLDAWRQAGWFAHEAIMAAILLAAYLANEVVIWSGDLNRPPSTFSGTVLPKFRIAGAATSEIVETDGTHGRTIFDYVGILSRKLKVTVAHWSTPDFNSDHDGVLVEATWPDPAPKPTPPPIRPATASEDIEAWIAAYYPAPQAGWLKPRLDELRAIAKKH